MSTEEPVVAYYKDTLLELQKAICDYYEGNIESGVSHFGMAKQKIETMQYHMFRTTHRSGKKG